MKHRQCFYILFCALVLANCLNAIDVPTCNRGITESYGLISYTRPSKEKLVFCPNIRATCCPAYEQFKIFKDYNERVRPLFVASNDLVAKELMLLKKAIVTIMTSGGLDQRITSFPDPARQMKLISSYMDIVDQDIEKILDKTLQYQKKAVNYISSLKSSFFCTICDYSNQLFIDTDKKTITFNEDSCDSLASNTILYTNLLNTVLVPYLEKFTFIIAELNGTRKYQKLHNFGKVLGSVKNCALNFAKADSRLSDCRQYCSLFRFNTDNPVFEGYPELFANTLVETRKYSPGGGAAPAKSAAKANRILFQKENSFSYAPKPFGRNLSSSPSEKPIKKSRHLGRLLEETSLPSQKPHMEAHVTQKMLEERFLQADRRGKPDFVDEFDPQNTSLSYIDLFDAASSDDEFDDKMVVDMMEAQDAYSTGGNEDMGRVVKRFVAENFIADIDDLNDPQIFSTGSDSIYELDKFKTIFGFVGIDSGNIVANMNWSLQDKDIAKSLSGAVTDQNDVLDPDVLNVINAVGNNAIKNFYQNNFLDFQEVSPDASLENILRQARFKKYRARIQKQIFDEMIIFRYFKEKAQKKDADEVWQDVQAKKKQLRYVMFKEFLLSLPLGITFEEVQQIYDLDYYEVTEPDREMLKLYYSQRNTKALTQLRKDSGNATISVFPFDIGNATLPAAPASYFDANGQLVSSNSTSNATANATTKASSRKLRSHARVYKRNNRKWHRTL